MKDKICKCGHVEENHQEAYAPSPYGCRNCYCRKFIKEQKTKREEK